VQLSSFRSELASELKASWALFAAGVLREAYATATPTRVVFVLEAADRAQADAELRKSPLIAAGHLSFGLIELHPFVKWVRCCLLAELAPPGAPGAVPPATPTADPGCT
jgi:hypothetical protein